MKQLFFIGILFSTLQGLAQDNPIKDDQLKALIQKAVTNYPRIKELEEQLNVYAVKDEIAKSNYLPNISAEAGYRFFYPVPSIDFNGANLKFQPVNNYDGHIGISQLVYDFGKTKLQLERTKTERQLTQTNIDNSKNAVAYQVTQIYYGIRFLLKSVTVQEEQIKTLKENEQLIQSKLKNGDALEYDLLTTQVRTKNAENRLEDIKSQLEKQYIYLQLLTGEDQRATIKPSEDKDMLQLISDIAQTNWKTSNAEATLLQKQLELYNYDLKAAVVNNRPAVLASAASGFKNGFVPDIEKLKFNVNAGIGVSVPIFSGNRTKLQQKLTQVNIATTKKSLETVQANIQKDLATVNADYKNLQVKLENTNTLVQQAQRAFSLAKTRFKEGLITNVELLGAQTNVEDATLQQVQLQYQMTLDKLESYKIAGTKIF